MNNKLNPRRIPRTQADVDAAEIRGTELGLQRMLTIFLFVLKDKYNASDDDIRQLGKDVNFYCKQLNKGEIKLHDIKLALKEEFDLNVRF